MTGDGWFTLVVLSITIAVLVRDVVAPSLAIMGAVIALLVAGVLTPAQALGGFANPAPITVAAMYVLARAVEKTGALQSLVAATLGDGRSERMSLMRLLLPSATASAFVNNTPIVAILVPQVMVWAERTGRSASRYLMPLAFAVTLGGMTTLIGTSTNLVVSDLLESAGFEPLGMFEQTRVGLPVMLVGLVVLVLLAPVLLPKRAGAHANLSARSREFTVSMRVETGGGLDGQAVERGGLRHLQGVYLIAIEREGALIAPVSPTMTLRGEDLLTFVGRSDVIVDLQLMRGLVSAEEKHLSAFGSARHTYFEAVIGETSPLVGKTLREVGFRERFQAAVVAIHRGGAPVDSKLGAVRLRVGDMLLVLGDPGFENRWRDRPDFLLISRIGGTAPAVTKKTWIVGAIAVAIVLSASVGLLPILQSTLLGAILLVVLGVLTPGEARASVDLDVLLVIAGGFGLGAAIQETGLATLLAQWTVTLTSPLGAAGSFLGVTLATVVLTELLTNNAAVAIAFPIAIATAREVNADPRAFAIAIAIAASASFLTPIGYQTNTMVYGPGSYRFSDYWRLGLPLTVVTLVLLIGVLM